MDKTLRWLTIVLGCTAAVLGIGLLASDTAIGIPRGVPAGIVSAAPLFLIGVTFLIAQIIIRPRWMDLLKNVLLATAFILWSVVQLMGQNALSKRLGDFVIALYVLDLAWVIFASLSPAERFRSGPSGN